MNLRWNLDEWKTNLSEYDILKHYLSYSVLEYGSYLFYPFI